MQLWELVVAVGGVAGSLFDALRVVAPLALHHDEREPVDERDHVRATHDAVGAAHGELACDVVHVAPCLGCGGVPVDVVHVEALARALGHLLHRLAEQEQIVDRF